VLYIYMIVVVSRPLAI